MEVTIVCFAKVAVGSISKGTIVSVVRVTAGSVAKSAQLERTCTGSLQVPKDAWTRSGMGTVRLPGRT